MFPAEARFYKVVRGIEIILPNGSVLQLGTESCPITVAARNSKHCAGKKRFLSWLGLPDREQMGLNRYAKRHLYLE